MHLLALCFLKLILLGTIGRGLCFLTAESLLEMSQDEFRIFSCAREDATEELNKLMQIDHNANEFGQKITGERSLIFNKKKDLSQWENSWAENKTELMQKLCQKFAKLLNPCLLQTPGIFTTRDKEKELRGKIMSIQNNMNAIFSKQMGMPDETKKLTSPHKTIDDKSTPDMKVLSIMDTLENVWQMVASEGNLPKDSKNIQRLYSTWFYLNEIVVQFLIESEKHGMTTGPGFLKMTYLNNKKIILDQEKWGSIFFHYLWGKIPQKIDATTLYLNFDFHSSFEESLFTHELYHFLKVNTEQGNELVWCENMIERSYIALQIKSFNLKESFMVTDQQKLAELAGFFLTYTSDHSIRGSTKITFDQYMEHFLVNCGLITSILDWNSIDSFAGSDMVNLKLLHNIFRYVVRYHQPSLENMSYKGKKAYHQLTALNAEIMDLSDSYKEIYARCGELLQGIALLHPQREEVLRQNTQGLLYLTDITKKNDDKLFTTGSKSQENIASYTESGSEYLVSIADKEPQEKIKALFQSWKNQYNDSPSKSPSRTQKPTHCKSIRASSQIKLQVLQTILAKSFDEKDLSFENLDKKLKELKTLLHHINIYYNCYWY